MAVIFPGPMSNTILLERLPASVQPLGIWDLSCNHHWLACDVHTFQSGIVNVRNVRTRVVRQALHTLCRPLFKQPHGQPRVQDVFVRQLLL